MAEPLAFTAVTEQGVAPTPGSGACPTWSADEEFLLRDLVREHATRLRRFIIKHIGNTSEADDLAQQAFVEAARSYQAFRGESQLSTWLYGIALNLVRNHLSRAPERRYEFVSTDALDDHVSASQSPCDQVEQQQTMQALSDSLNELPENMRDILLMVGVDDLSYEEAAAMLMVPIGTIRSRLSRARSALREKLNQRGISLND
jgi:RNA polymerase sigma-70 factor (ECF subfamily)